VHEHHRCCIPAAQIENPQAPSAGLDIARRQGVNVIEVRAPFGKAANRPCLELLMSYAKQQGLISGRLTVDQLWSA